MFVVPFFGLISLTLGAGVGTAWDVSPGQQGYTTHPTWPRVDLSAFEIRSVSGIGKLTSRDEASGQANSKREAKEVEDMETDYVPEVLFDHPVFKGIFKKPRNNPDVEMLPGPWEKSRKPDRVGRNRQACPESLEEDLNSDEVVRERPRVRREVEEPSLEKVTGTKNVREPRLNSPESWSKQPLAVEFRHRTNLEGNSAEDEDSRLMRHQAPRTDFVTANRRSYEGREARDLAIGRGYEDVPYRNSLRDRDLDVAYSRGYYYPDHFRTERDYLIRGVNDPGFSADRYRIEDYDMYRNRPTPKPKRIIYYATLPEIVRKPVDTRRPYDFRPYDTVGRASIPPIRDSAYRRLPGMLDLKYQYRYPYGHDSYDPYGKRTNYWERPYASYDRLDDTRYREQDLDHASFKEAPRSDEGVRTAANSVEGRSTDKLPWPVQVGTELNIKDNERVTGRKVFGQQEDYERFRQNSRMEREGNGEATDAGNNRD
ncbi:uncharacterized protein LOC107041317 [Diachasma alloeum]|uniref:uncharacterized protein LOC107041317 n=1 Tax=Diachasma alloeum TaxID=454923 RepID=UPI000738395D|nr:uncharacterized protein LOC107041317 [Diachasma alloeum]